MTKKIIIIFFISLTIFNLFAIDLSHIKDPNQILIIGFNKQEKSRILSRKGARLYETELVQKINFDEIDSIRQYFILALFLDKNNTEAIKYLKRTNAFKSKMFNKNYSTAMKYFYKKKRNEQDNFNLCFYLQRSLEIDPSHVKAIALKEEVWPIYTNLVRSYNKEAQEIGQKIRKEKDGEKRDALFLDGLDKYSRILLLDPANENARRGKEQFIVLIINNLKDIIDQTKNEIKKHKFEDALKSIQSLKWYNRKIENRLRKEILELEYDVYLSQAEKYYNQNKLTLARNKVNSALYIRRTREARNLKTDIDKKIYSQAAHIKSKINITARLDEIEELIREKELSIAKDKILDLMRRDPGSKKTLNKYLKQVQSIIDKEIAPLYKEAVNDYNNEDYKSAIVKFRQVMELDDNYENAENYLQKAKEKQKVLESF